LPGVGSSSFHNNFSYNPGVIGGANLVMQPNVGGQLGQQPISIPPLRPSIIDMSRPTRNIFPSDTYVTKTKFDENLIIMVEDDEEGDDNEPDSSSPFMAANTVPQQV
jgi:hypothetical protein